MATATTPGDLPRTGPEPAPIWVALLSSDIWLKSNRTRGRMIRMVVDNLAAALGGEAAVSYYPGHRLRIDGGGTDAARAASRVFGIAAVERLDPVPHRGFDDLAERVAERFADRVRGRTFAVRTRRRGEHGWRSHDLNCRIGDLLVAAGGTVDLTAPEVAVAVRVGPEEAAVLGAVIPGPGGLPLGSQERVLALVSGGIDSPVAAWMMMSRGCGVDVLHFVLDCAQADHALAVAYRLWSEWGHGDRPTAHVVDFREVAGAIVESVPGRLRQVALKALMVRASAALAAEEGAAAVVTGEALGQVSSQTLTHLAALSAQSATPLLRPLVALDKEEIQRRARDIGTFELSARAREVCDLSDGGPVETAASTARVGAVAGRVDESLWRAAVDERIRLPLADWIPGAITL